MHIKPGRKTVERSSSEKPGRKGPTLPEILAFLYKPFLPLVNKINLRRRKDIHPNPEDIRVPKGYNVEVVAFGFDAPTHCTFDEQGNCYVTESGHKITRPPRILKINIRTGEWSVFYQFPESRWFRTGAVTGACWHKGYLYVMNTDTLSRLDPKGNIEDLVTGLPGLGDHQANFPLIGPDEKIYFGVGTATNAGIVGADNAAYEWLPYFPEVHDIPGGDVRLLGRNFYSADILGSPVEQVLTGAFQSFGTASPSGQVVKGEIKSNGSILRCNLDGTDLELVAWGLRNPYGLAFHPDGRLFATEHGMDERGRRYVVGDLDDLYEIRQGEWYGFPDFASGMRLDDPFWGEGGQGREPVLAEFPNPTPPKPAASFETHSAANGIDFSRNDFGFKGEAFVALFGDISPITTTHFASTPRGFKVVRVDPDSGHIYDFAVNRIAGPASLLPHKGFERPSHCQFGPDGALYVVDFGKIQIAPEKGSIRMVEGTGVLWRIRRTSRAHGQLPPKPVTLPVYLLRATGMALIITGAILGIRSLTKKKK